MSNVVSETALINLNIFSYVLFYAVRGALCHLLGVFAERFPEHIPDAAVKRLLSIYLAMLKKQVTDLYALSDHFCKLSAFSGILKLLNNI